MIRVEEAVKIILKNIKFIGAERVAITAILGRVLAEDIYADSDMPLFDNSAMDGYAVRASDTKGASGNKPKVLTLIGELRAGEITDKILRPNQAIRIMTGAPIPGGADSVIMVEQTKLVVSCQLSVVRNKELVKIFKEVKPGENIRRKGEDIKRGELVIRRGTLLKPAQIGLLAGLGRAEVRVAKKPKVAILASGDELVGLRQRLLPGKIRNSNTYALYSQVLNCGCVPRNLGTVKDNFLEIEKKIRSGLSSDMLLISGGVSVGKYDFVKGVLAKMGADIKFQQVAMRPGKPTVFGKIRHKPVFGLPGNAVSGMVSFEIFVKPAILKMTRCNDARKEVDARLEEDIAKRKCLRYFLRANTRWQAKGYVTKTSGQQGSAMLKSMVNADSLIILAEDKQFFNKGSKVKVRFLD